MSVCGTDKLQEGVLGPARGVFPGFQGDFFFPPFLEGGTLSFNSTGSLRFALAKCYKCFDNLVSDPLGSLRRARG